MAHLPYKEGEKRLCGVIGDEDTVTGFLLAGVGDMRNEKNFFVVNDSTPHSAIENAFKEMTNRADIAILIINQCIANDVRYLLETYEKILPVIIEIPSKKEPYDLAKDYVLQRCRGLL
eukprot:TRINITY_DN44542_c0_g1_i1.p1 TRINITY_DN44542_c0_g1~~TRINITY_DN44542_c0_g1_i1.p1  ORF type:complete len:118 (-),score=25.65 TRINITY_DN44542_c0_g1_i1:576-929(-)